ncbi:MAG: aquaporin Z [Acidobacteriaceae bacterium]
MKKYFAELVGTYVLVFSGVGAAVLAGKHIGNVGVAFAFGLSLLVMVYAIGPISGCHINPAVTFGMWLSRKINGKDSIMYVIAQVIGAVLAAGCVLFIARGMPGGYVAHISGLASNGYALHSPDLYSMSAGFVAEIILTAFLVFTVIGATDIKAPVGFAGLAIGLVLTVDHLVGIPITNTSVNPARSIGPAVFARGWALHQLWLFIVAPLIGGAIAAGVFALVRSRPEPTISTREAERALLSQQSERNLAKENLAS